MTIVPVKLDVAMSLLSVRITMNVPLILAVKKKVVNSSLFAVMITMLVLKILVLLYLDA